ncbi:hypothetical protein J2T16_000671 [Paenibacillus intestini]|nr:hypothetical protein [Paenibacillus intestini]
MSTLLEVNAEHTFLMKEQMARALNREGACGLAFGLA